MSKIRRLQTSEQVTVRKNQQVTVRKDQGIWGGTTAWPDSRAALV